MGLSTGGGAWSVGQATVGDGTAGIPGGNGLGASALGSPVVSPRMVLKRVIRQHHHHKDSSANQFNHNEVKKNTYIGYCFRVALGLNKVISNLNVP